MTTVSLLRLRFASLGTTTSCLLRASPGTLLPRPSASQVTTAASSAALFAYPVLSASFSATSFRSTDHKEETFDEFNSRFEKEFEKVQDVFELQRNLNNVFAYDLVPSAAVIAAALRAARRVNDFPTAVRVFEGVKCKVQNREQYQQYLDELKDLREEYSVPLKEDMYPDDPKKWRTMT